MSSTRTRYRQEYLYGVRFAIGLAEQNTDSEEQPTERPAPYIEPTIEPVSYGDLSFSPDGKTLATGNQDNVVTLWHLATGQEMAVLHGHQGLVESVAFSPDGSILASASEDNTVRLWRAATRAEIDTDR